MDVPTNCTVVGRARPGVGRPSPTRQQILIRLEEKLPVARERERENDALKNSFGGPPRAARGPGERLQSISAAEIKARQVLARPRRLAINLGPNPPWILTGGRDFDPVVSNSGAWPGAFLRLRRGSSGPTGRPDTAVPLQPNFTLKTFYPHLIQQLLN